jgi:hypothetical protein
MRILIVSARFAPDSSPRAMRATELAREFVRLGHEVTVVTEPDELRDGRPSPRDTGELKPLLTRRWPDAPALATEGMIGRAVRGARRLLGLLAEYPDVELVLRVREVLRVEGGYDLLVSIAHPYPIHWGVALASAGRGRSLARTWVADCGDPYMGATLERFRKPFYFAVVERWFCRAADYIAVPTSGAVEGYYPEFREKIRVIPQGFDLTARPASQEPVQNPVPTFAYAGGLAPRGVRSPVRFLEHLLQHPGDFRFHVFAARGGKVVEPYVEASRGRVVLHPGIPRDQLLARLRQMDFMVNFDNGVTRQTPSKLIDYTLTKRPILNVAPESPDLGMVDRFLAGDYAERLEVPDIDSYDIRRVAQQFLTLCEGFRAPGGGGVG